MNKDEFREQLEKSIQRLESYDSKYRAKQNKVIGDRFYEEIHRRLATTRELQDLPLNTLLTKLRELNNEIRTDTPGDVTSRGEVSHKHEIMDKIMERYKESQSEQPKLSLVELPTKKDGTNG